LKKICYLDKDNEEKNNRIKELMEKIDSYEFEKKKLCQKMKANELYAKKELEDHKIKIEKLNNIIEEFQNARIEEKDNSLKSEEKKSGLLINGMKYISFTNIINDHLNNDNKSNNNSILNIKNNFENKKNNASNYMTLNKKSLMVNNYNHDIFKEMKINKTLNKTISIKNFDINGSALINGSSNINGNSNGIEKNRIPLPRKTLKNTSSINQSNIIKILYKLK
jgi:hypothetical protein